MNSRFFFRVFPFVSFSVTGESMMPAIRPESMVLVQKRWFFCTLAVGDIIALTHPKTHQFLVKRITAIEKNRYFVRGDNTDKSTDSTVFGWIDRTCIVGKVIFS